MSPREFREIFHPREQEDSSMRTIETLSIRGFIEKRDERLRSLERSKQTRAAWDLNKLQKENRS